MERPTRSVPELDSMTTFGHVFPNDLKTGKFSFSPKTHLAIIITHALRTTFAKCYLTFLGSIGDIFEPLSFGVQPHKTETAELKRVAGICA